MNSLGDCAQTARAMINRVHRRDHGEKNLRRANVARCFVAADVLFARLQRESIGGPTVGIVGNSDKYAWHVPFVFVAGREVSRGWSADSKRNAKALRMANDDVSTAWAGRSYESERE